MERIGMLPSGMSICSSVPDLLFLPELVFGAAVWILVACTKVVPANPQAYVLAVSLFCFITTFIWMMMFLCGAHHNQTSWATADLVYHCTAALLYLSSSVLLAYVTSAISPFSQVNFTPYKLNVSAVVFSFWTTLQYIVHAALSAIRWKSF
ncbi:myelin and lymphocyte protein-like [Tachysurus fulvidraco]|uniref:myelin and lymphocyte protein-like n=1 Tax=Tachysurus fulvidraco TaxID=1234273 RepID=UPI000F4E828D|nr:myelin and lymphocyte protein-like [Tachysurus fulvidraco]